DKQKWGAIHRLMNPGAPSASEHPRQNRGKSKKYRPGGKPFPKHKRISGKYTGKKAPAGTQA
ncbi:MAG: hypothetical protein KGI97_08680, partial [Alphaproteobacteria bacterium]|nr:hypothetical protein [Alphaproteobacteria bacterium]